MSPSSYLVATRARAAELALRAQAQADVIKEGT